MAKETKIGLALCMLLIGAFAFVVYSKMNPQRSADGIDDHVVQSDDGSDEESEGSNTSENDPPVQEANNEHDHKHDFTHKQHESNSDKIGFSQNEPDPPAQSDPRQQASPWESHTKGHQQTAANNVSQTSRSRQDDPFATTSQSQTVRRQKFDEESQTGSTQQQQPVEFGNIDEHHHHDSYLQQTTDEGDPFGAAQTSAAQSETHHHEDHQQRKSNEFNPFEDSESERQVDSDIQQTEPQTEQSQFAGQNDDQQDFTQHTHEDSTRKNRYHADTEEPAPFGPTDGFDSEPHKHPPFQTDADSAKDESGSSADETHSQNEWSHHHPPNDGTEQQQQSAEQRADPFDPYAPTQQSVEQDSDEPDGFSQQSPSTDHVHQHHEQSNYRNTYQQQREFDSHLTKSADAAIRTYADRPSVYVVRSGDNYWNISRKQYGAGRYYKALARYNRQRIPDPQKMRPGMKVLVPSRELLEQRFPELFPRRRTVAAIGNSSGHHKSPGFFTSTTGEMLYRVGPNDTLTGIAKRHLGRASRWVQIYGLNRRHISDPGRLKIGTVLHLPADASRVQLVRDARGLR